MKSKFWLISLLAIAHWLRDAYSASNCASPFQEVPYSTGTYCAKCDTTCATCSGSSINQCSTCPTDFTLNSNSSTCEAPITTSINTVANSYHFFGFIAESTWPSSIASPCGTFTILKPALTELTTTHTLGVHYQVRIRVSFWTISQINTMGLHYSSGSYLFQDNSPSTVASFYTGQSYDPTCTGAYAVNYQKYINDSLQNTVSVTVKFTSTALNWGINQYVFMEYLCHSDCSSCLGPGSSNCTSCLSTIKSTYSYPGPCLCKYQSGYYAYPTGNSTYYCVNPCPNLPSGQYYGDNFTKTCVLTCPANTSNTGFWGLSFASDQHGKCVNQCPATITFGNTPFKLYYDLIGRRCTTQCPTAQPYTNPTDRACYAACPINSGVQYYKLETDKSCVNICPNITNSSNGVQIPLYRDPTTLTCVQVCPSGYWGYTNATDGDRYCVINSCPSNQFTDNSTGRPLCTITCPGPNWFGDYYALPPACVTTCSFPNYGDQNSSARFCVPKCNGSVIPYYGTQSGNRQCVTVCPTGTWGQRISLVCVTQVFKCNLVDVNFTSTLFNTYNFSTTIKSFADSFSNLCIYANESCSNLMFKLNSSMTCELTCPSGTYANNLSFWCVDKCYGLYFGDGQLNQCVLVCSPGLYADIGSGNTCVSRCNQTGGYPYRDDDIRQCVSVCTNGYADPLVQSCVENCSPGLYLNGTDSANQSHKFCVYNCSSPYFAYNNTDSGICLMTCPVEPPLFGDTVSGLRVCVQVCTVNTYGDQVNGSYRHCVQNCQNNTFAQNDTLRRCVTRCNTSTYGRSTDWTCVLPADCPHNYTGDPTTNLCVNWCPPANGTFSDNNSKLCVNLCPNVSGTVYYADIHIRWCIPTCQQYNASVSQFGNNNTRTCESKCLDNDSYADAQSPRRYCIELCTHTVINNVTTKYYRNNFTMTCVVSTGCNSSYFADNQTAYCVRKCSAVPGPNSTTVQTWGYLPTQTCVALCLEPTFGDYSSGIPLCVSLCAQFPVPKWSYLGPNDDKSIMLCMTVCPSPYFGEDYLRTCVTNCPRETSTHNQTYAYDGTRRCLLQCPNNTFADYIQGVCYHYSTNCTIPCWYNQSNCSSYRWGDPYNNSCTYLCTASPWDTYGDNLTQTCTTNCSVNSYADSFTGKRTCIDVCPGYYNSQGVVDSSKVDINNVPYDSYGDNFTQRCVKNCVMPNTFADWQTHLCLYRCTGDLNTTIPTYASTVAAVRRCVIALSCPLTPDKYFGQNITRWCLPSCPLKTSTNNISFADNITRTCIPVCYEYVNVSSSNLTTRFYGDQSTGKPACVIACPIVPRLFGKNQTNLCVKECPDFQYGDQTGNRSCVPVCPLISGVTWFSQLTERICVTVCQAGTWGNYYNSSGPHCQTVPTDCKPGQFADNSTRLCVDLCPQSMNYFGDPSTRLCTTYCPFLNSSVLNITATINLTSGRLFADYKTRLCVYTCPVDFGLQGTFGDNSTNTCVERCPEGSFGDANTTNRLCVAQCTSGAYSDPLTRLCVDVCPASPPLFGYSGNSSCVASCPSGFWADNSDRTCKQDCNPYFRLSYGSFYQCVSICPSEPDLYADKNGYNCTPVCSAGQFADPINRICNDSCLPLFMYNYRCVKLCPKGFYANSSGVCVPPLECDNNTFGDNDTTKCVNPCPSWSYSDPISGYCIAVCPDGTYGQNNKCVSNCSVTNTSFSNITQLCHSTCPNRTYSLNGTCVPNCTDDTYQNEVTNLCSTTCTAGLYGDPTSHRCVSTCPYNWYRKSSGTNTGFCVAMNSGCDPLFADFYTGNCVANCSTGYWGFPSQTNGTHSFVGNYTCLPSCPDGMYGYDNGTDKTRICYLPNNSPDKVPSSMFADPVSGTFVTKCPQTPVLYYGDRNRQMCVTKCEPFNLTANTPTLFYGDPQSNQCQSTCTNTTYSADNITSLCTLRCSFGTFRYNNTPVCINPCFDGYGDYTTRICMSTCPISAGTFGFYNTTSGSRLCVSMCPSNYFSEPLQRTCTTFCPNSSATLYYAYNTTRECLLQCKDSFAFDDTRQCVTQCSGSNYPNADNSTNKCVATCPSSPDYYADSNVCVFYCTSANYFADPIGRVCTQRCSNGSAYIQYGDRRTGRCEKKCSQGTWGDNVTNQCVKKCPDGSFADNTTGLCVDNCSVTQGIYADMLLNVCAETCSGGYFGSQINQTCVKVCDDGFWGDPTTTLCTSVCPVKIYSYGENDTRTCVGSCFGFTGYADNFSRLCREYCQHTIAPQTYIDYTTLSCVQICPQGYWAANYTAPNNTINQCVQNCPSGYADNFSQWCVAVCPSDPQSYGDNSLKKCIYTCMNGQFSDNSTNLCVHTCPSLNSTPPVDYYGDPVNGRCVVWCTQGTFAQNSSRRCVNPCDTGQFADNLTRRCVTNCSQNTFADETTHRCVRICPPGFWAENTTRACIPNCWTYPSGLVSYADNLTNFCVATCPFDYFGTNTSHKCVKTCPESLNEFGHIIGRVCVGTNSGTGVVDCYGDNSTNITYYGDPQSRTCVQKCPLDLWADTHIFKCVPICDISYHEYRNNHTQMCVWPCPSDPDQYADPSSGDCVRTCPGGSYAYAAAGNRTCYPSCASFSRFADNTTNRCVSVCATKPYLYADNLTWQCSLGCSGGQFSDNRSQACVPVCPAEWAYFGQTHNYTCVSLCPAGQFADAYANRTCRLTCTNSYFADNFTSTCVEHCRFVRPFWYEDTSLGYGVCVSVCPGQSYGYNPDQTCKYYNNVTNTSTCPTDYFADRASRRCVKFCPNGTFADVNTKYCEFTCQGSYYADPILRKCVFNCSNNLYQYAVTTTSNLCTQYCPSPYFSQNSTATVAAKCTQTCTTLGLPSTRTCEGYCPHPYFANWAQHLCITNCTPKYAYFPNRTCLLTCQTPYYGNPLTFTCYLLCPNSTFGRNDTRMCDSGCPSGSYADPSIRICVADCPSSPLLYADSRTKQCLPSCSSPLFGFQYNNTCISACPNVTIGSQTKIYLADASNRLCVLSCVNALISFADYIHNECTQLCPNGTFASNYTKQCIAVCPNDPRDTFSDNTSRICMDVCLPGSFGMASKLNCVAECWWPFFADPTTRLCLQLCPVGYFAVNSTATCRTTCPDFSYADPVTRRCVAQCPALQLYFNYAGNWTCLQNCPLGFFANTDTKACESICNSSNGVFSYLPTNKCVRECPIPYRGYAPNYTCVLDCPKLYYFYDVTINVCAQCNSTCVICSSLSTCLQCKPGYNLFNGYCGRNCIPTATSITYADPSGLCVSVCPNTYFGDNSTYSCTQTCPGATYGDPSSRLCKNCPINCATCSSLTVCITCQTSATLAIDKLCYSNCNSTSKYSYNGTCYNICPPGTYLTYTGVTCAACSSVCSTCFGSATTCTSCATTYYYADTCLTKCPTGYYGSTSPLQCISCSGSSAPACTNPLSFTTSFSTSNFQPVITLQFNENVTMSKNLSDILQINLKITRLLEETHQQRLLQVGTIVNNGVTYTYEILSNGTIKLYPQITGSLVSPTFSVQITDPASVISTTTGVSLQNVESLLAIAVLEYYPPSDGKEAGTNFPAKFVTILALVLYAIIFVFSDAMVRPLQILQIFFFHCLIDVNVPANLFYFLLQMKESSMYFVQNWFEKSLPSLSPYYDTPLKLADVFIDETFLRHIGPMFVLLTVLGCFWFVFLILGNKRLMKHKVWQGFCEQVSKKRYQIMVINDAFSLFYFPIFYFAFMQLRNLVGSTPFYAFNSFITILFLIIAIILPLAYVFIWKIKSSEELSNVLWFLTTRVKHIKSDKDLVVVHDEKSQQYIKQNSNGEVEQDKSKHERNGNYLQGVVFMVYQILMAVWMTAFYTYPKAQLVLLIITNSLLLCYHLKFRPHLNFLNLIFYILSIAFLISVEAMYIYFSNNTLMTPNKKTNAAYNFLVAADIFCVLLVLWVVWRVVWEASLYWNKFKKTQLYLQFADHDYAGEQEQSEKFSQYEKKVQKFDVGLGDLVIDEIIEKVGQSGQRVIAVKKKRLVKKLKVQGRRKKDGNELLPEESNRQDYVRVNHINIFDYNHQFDEPEPQHQLEPQPQIQMPKRRNIDDDIRDIISDYSENLPNYKQQYEEEQQKKIDLQPGEYLISNLESISAVDDAVQKSQKISDYPFLEIEQGHEDCQPEINEEQKMQQEQVHHPNIIQDIYDPKQPQEQQQYPSQNYEEEQIKDQPKQEEIQSSSNLDIEQAPQGQQEFKVQQQQEQPVQVAKKEQGWSQIIKEDKVQPVKIMNIEDLLKEEQSSKKRKNLLFLFDDFEDQNNQA